VEVIPLIAASIMSKKIAESLTGLVLDIKRGSGSFLPELEREIELAQAMIDLGVEHACPVVALVTAMDRPLGHACGNALEVAEAIDVLKGEGPPDLIEVTLALGAEMLILGTLASTREGARAMMDAAIRSGKALRKFEEIITAQGGDAGVVRDPLRLPQAPHRSDFTARRGGVVQSVDPRAVGYGVIALGGGRRNMEEKVDPSVGFVITAKPQDRVSKGQVLATVFARSKKDLESGRAVLEQAIAISDSAPPALPLVSHRITARGVEALS
jgi:thymidine phosphorylase